MGSHTFALATIFLVGAGCADGDQGAVSVRWRIVDLQSAVGYDPRAQGAADGSCIGPDGAWVVHNIALMVADPVTGAVIAIDPPTEILFSCRQREATTGFRIPLGRFTFDLCPFSTDSTVCDEGVTPGPAIRTVRKAEIINLDVIQIGVRAPRPMLPVPTPGPATRAPSSPI